MLNAGPCSLLLTLLLALPPPSLRPPSALSLSQADAEEDTWEDDEPAAEKPAAPKVIMIGRVIRDFFPETSTRRHLTLLLGARPLSRLAPLTLSPLTRPPSLSSFLSLARIR